MYAFIIQLSLSTDKLSDLNMAIPLVSYFTFFLKQAFFISLFGEFEQIVALSTPGPSVVHSTTVFHT